MPYTAFCSVSEYPGDAGAKTGGRVPTPSEWVSQNCQDASARRPRHRPRNGRAVGPVGWSARTRNRFAAGEAKMSDDFAVLGVIAGIALVTVLAVLVFW